MYLEVIVCNKVLCYVGPFSSEEEKIEYVQEREKEIPRHTLMKVDQVKFITHDSLPGDAGEIEILSPEQFDFRIID